MKKYKQQSLSADLHHLGKGLFNLAVKFSREPMTCREREETIKRAKVRRKKLDGKGGIRHIRIEVDKVADRIRSNREARQQARRSRRRNHPRPQKIPLDMSIPLERRLIARIEQRVRNCIHSRYRVDQEAGYLDVHVTQNPSQVGIRQTESLDWNYYSKSTRYPKKVVGNDVTIPRAYSTRVTRRGLSVVDGMATLDAQLMDSPEGVEVYAATWLRQGSGYSISSVRGFIARAQGGAAYHADSPQKAIRGLKRKIQSAEISERVGHLLDSRGIEIAALASDGATVSLSDARAIGACEYGIQSWCHSVGLDYSAGKAPMTEVYAAYRRYPLPEARAAILRAIRRQRRCFQSLAA